jgi:hypothetical protein
LFSARIDEIQDFRNGSCSLIEVVLLLAEPKWEANPNPITKIVAANPRRMRNGQRNALRPIGQSLVIKVPSFRLKNRTHNRPSFWIINASASSRLIAERL